MPREMAITAIDTQMAVRALVTHLKPLHDKRGYHNFLLKVGMKQYKKCDDDMWLGCDSIKLHLTSLRLNWFVFDIRGTLQAVSRTIMLPQFEGLCGFSFGFVDEMISEHR